jgi:peptidoglycan/LPS O-acetylase OafA/YrhL
MSSKSDRNPVLDGIRGVAISLVVLYHAFYVFGEAPLGSTVARLMAMARLGWNGVDLFFVLSGFLIGGILLDAKGSPQYYKTFYARRAFRILPLYFTVLCAYGLCSIFLPTTGARFPALAYLTLTQNLWAAAAGELGLSWLSCTWSLAIEEQFYLVAPTLIRLTSKRALGWLVIATIVADPVIRAVLALSFPHGAFAAHVLMFTRADALMFGVGAALLVRSPKARSTIERHMSALTSATVVCAAALAWFTKKDWTIGSLPMVTIGYSLQAFFFASLLLIAVLRERGFLAQLLSARILRFLGQRAYAIYLFNGPFLYISFLLAGQAPRVSTWREAAIAVASVAVSLAIAELSWIFLEQPMLERGRSYRY